ncbi:MAG TPA: hypothetical protein VK508_03035 [Cyclobacteriaceae bacterium]|nr:hypothetical protein [Cyclobacteriaceae bacterium]
MTRTRRKHTLLVLSVLLLTVSCREDDPPRVVFTVTVDESYVTATDDTYIILHNTNGDLIEYKPLESGETIEFETAAKTPGDKVDVTIARIYGNPSGRGLTYLWSYLEVPAGQSWTLTYRQVTYGPAREYDQAGTYTMLLNNFNGAVARSISDRNYLLPSSTSNSPSSLTASIYSQNHKHLLSLDNGTNLKYRFIEDPKNGETYTFDFNQMTAFDKTISVPFTEPSYVYAHVMGYETMEDFRYLTGFVLYNSISSGQKRNSLNIGYLNSMLKFRTEIRLGAGKWEVSHVSRGAAPASLLLPSPSAFTFQEKFAHSVVYSSTVPVTYRVSYFMSEGLTSTEGTHWYFYAPEGRTRQPSFPDALREKYPMLDVGEFRHYSTTFYTKTWPYETFLAREFGGMSRKAEEDEFEDVAVVLY